MNIQRRSHGPHLKIHVVDSPYSNLDSLNYYPADKFVNLVTMSLETLIGNSLVDPS